ncbi:MAG: hypothetical protein MJ010_06680 [Paludibacteraceae bacterium]|nr:hypothetical protein [Paludibacteraceae bacterium]
MKKIISILSVFTVAVIVTVCISCKKDEPSKSLDFSNLTMELIESCYGQDSVSVVNNLVEQGFIQGGEIYHGMHVCYMNNSYGLEYQFAFENKKVIGINGRKSYATAEDRKQYLKDEQNLINKHLPYFQGACADNEWNPGGVVYKFCTDMAKEYLEYIEKNKYSMNYVDIANDNVVYGVSWLNDERDTNKSYYNIHCCKSDPNDPYSDYNFVKHGCNYDPWNNPQK